MEDIKKIKVSLELVKQHRMLSTTEDNILAWCKYRLEGTEKKTIHI